MATKGSTGTTIQDATRAMRGHAKGVTRVARGGAKGGAKGGTRGRTKGTKGASQSAAINLTNWFNRFRTHLRGAGIIADGAEAKLIPCFRTFFKADYPPTCPWGSSTSESSTEVAPATE